jgi:chromosomal replication initiation ATPase DnaA
MHREAPKAADVPKVELPADLDPDKGRAAWSAIDAEARKHINPHSYDTWLKPVRAIGVSGRTLLLKVPTQEFELIGRKYGEVIEMACQRLGLEGVQFIQAAALHEVRA